MSQLFAGIEAGGTKFVCAVSDANGKILQRVVIPTSIPDETMPQVIKFFQAIHSGTPLSAIGIATFGPVDLNLESPTYGYITTPPKPGWGQYDIVGAIKKVFKLPIGFDTDVNGAAIGEYRFGAAKNLDTFLYVTVGTGIGAGEMVSGKLVHGLIHPEMGHMFVPKLPEDNNFTGVCPFHKNCLEGLASGPAMQKRWNTKAATDLPLDHPAWDLEAKYLAYAFANCVLILSPQRIIVGGGVMKCKELYSKIRNYTRDFLNGYIKHEQILGNMENFIVEPGLGDEAGISGALALAEQAFLEKNSGF